MNYKRSWMRKIQPFLPKSIRYKIFRQKLVITSYVSRKLEIRPAQTKSELEQAFKILHDSYVECGFMSSDISGLRMHKYSMLPSTTTLIALWDGQVIGTATIIRRSALGLPLESAFDIDELCADGSTVGEISGLALTKEFRHNRSVIFLPFCKYIFEYAKTCLKLEKIVIATHPKDEDLYEGIFCMDRLSPYKVDEYEFANDNPAIGFYYDMKKTEKKFMDIYSVKPIHKNMYYFFYGFQPDSFIYPEEKYMKAQTPAITPELFHYFFIEKSKLYQTLSEQEKQIIFGLYPKNFSKDFYNYADQRRKEGRYFVDSSAVSSLGAGDSLRVIDISKTGMRVRVDEAQFKIYEQQARRSDKFTVDVKLHNKKFSHVLATVQWLDPKTHQVGLNIVQHDQHWDDYIDYLNSDFKAAA